MAVLWSYPSCTEKCEHQRDQLEVHQEVETKMCLSQPWTACVSSLWLIPSLHVLQLGIDNVTHDRMSPAVQQLPLFQGVVHISRNILQLAQVSCWFLWVLLIYCTKEDVYYIFSHVKWYDYESCRCVFFVSLSFTTTFAVLGFLLFIYSFCCCCNLLNWRLILSYSPISHTGSPQGFSLH